MAHSDPQQPDPHGAPDSSGEALRRLEERLERASDAAERLIAEVAASSAASLGRAAQSAAHAAESAARAAGGTGADAGKPPPAGWQTPSSDDEAQRPDGDVDVLAQVIHSLRDLVPPDLQRRLAAALRELLLAVRALIDWYLERVDQRRTEPTDVQDIPIM